MIKSALIALALVAAIPAQATTYFLDVVRPVTVPGFTGPSPDFIQGTITTDCNNCVMIQRDIVDWDLTIATHAGLSTQLLGPLSGNNSYVLLGGGPLVATSLGLFMDFPAGNLSFNGIVDPVSGLSPGVVQFFQSSNSAFIIGWANPGGSAFINPTSDLIGTAVPEPSTWALMLLGFAFIAIMVNRTRHGALYRQ